MVTKATQPDPHFWKGRRVLVTGHTGFKGGWLALWLAKLGAQVSGIALAPDTNPALFEVGRVGEVCASQFLDVRDAAGLQQAVHTLAPEIVFHLAAQPLVRESYRDPVGTWQTNVMGTIHLLEALRSQPEGKLPRAVVVVTSDKCYENRETGLPFRESDALGGHDPYSSSKAAAELVVASWRRSFLATAGIGLASARAGNVVGGGDWSADRLVPDLLRGYDANVSVPIRFPNAVRPWQHVLESLTGYLRLAEKLVETPALFASAWNFGPSDNDIATVSEVANMLGAQLGQRARWHNEGGKHLHEAGQLMLDSARAQSALGWTTHWSVTEALQATITWHAAWRAGEDMQAYSLRQIDAYLA